MWTHSGWEDCDAVCGGGKIKEKCTNAHAHVKNIYVYTVCMHIQYSYIWVYAICMYM